MSPYTSCTGIKNVYAFIRHKSVYVWPHGKSRKNPDIGHIIGKCNSLIHYCKKLSKSCLYFQHYWCYLVYSRNQNNDFSKIPYFCLFVCILFSLYYTRRYKISTLVSYFWPLNVFQCYSVVQRHLVVKVGNTALGNRQENMTEDAFLKY